jgi:uncharacterized glyoxalase superfamily protein PhnB
MSVKPIPDGYSTLTPFIVAEDAAKLCAFLEQAFGASHVHPPSKRPDGSIAHAEMQVGSSRVMIGGATDPAMLMPAMLYMYVEDCDAAFKRAVEAGAETIMPLADMFYGDRHGGIKDAWGNQWWIATHVEDVEPAELERRMAEEMKKRAAEGR